MQQQKTIFKQSNNLHSRNQIIQYIIEPEYIKTKRCEWRLEFVVTFIAVAVRKSVFRIAKPGEKSSKRI